MNWNEKYNNIKDSEFKNDSLQSRNKKEKISNDSYVSAIFGICIFIVSIFVLLCLGLRI